MNSRHLFREVVVVWLATMVAIRVIATFLTGVAWDIGLVLVPFLFMYVPVWVLAWRGDDPDRYPLTVPLWEAPSAHLPALALVAKVVALILVPYVLGYHLWQTWGVPTVLGVACDAGVEAACVTWKTPVPRFRLPPDVVMLALYHLVFVALPEELFYRGYIQTRLDEVWPPSWTVFGARVGPGLLVTCVIFAVGHSIVQFQYWHLAIVFPSLIFGWMRAKTGDILAGAWFHAFCNVSVAILDASYGLVGPQ